MSDRRDNNLTPFVGGTLNQRLRRSAHDGKAKGSLEQNLSRAIEEALVLGDQVSEWGERPEPFVPKQASPEVQADLARETVRAIVAGSSGASRTLRREDRLRREARQAELERQRVQREASDVIDQLMEDDTTEEVAPDWMVQAANEYVAMDDDEDDDDLDTQVYW